MTERSMNTLTEQCKNLTENDLTLYHDKWVKVVKNKVYCGQMLTGRDGKYPRRELEVVVDTPGPQNQSDVSWDLPNYVPNFSQVFPQYQAPYVTPCSWESLRDKENVFEQIINLVTQAPPPWSTATMMWKRIQTSNSCIACWPKHNFRIARRFAHVNLLLGSIEKRYSYSVYLYGFDLEICTVHEPLFTVLGAKIIRTYWKIVVVWKVN